VSTDSGPELRAVTADETELPAAAQPSPKSTEPARKPPWLILALAAAFGIAALGYGVERSRASALEREMAGLQSELQSAHRSLEAHQRRMGVVRAHVDDLAASIGLLQETVSEPAE